MRTSHGPWPGLAESPLRGRLARRVRETVRGNGLAGKPVPRPGPTSHLAGACDTLVADADGIYHPGLFNDRLLLGMKGQMSEALCRYRHRASYADAVVMPRRRRRCRLRLAGRPGFIGIIPSQP